MTITLFDEDFIIKAHELEIKKEAEIKSAIEILQENGFSYEETIDKIIQKYKLYRDEAEEYMDDYWRKAE